MKYVILLCCGFACSSSAAEVRFNQDVRPILSNRCFTCHGPDGNTREAGLRLDRRDDAVAKLPSGAVAVLPGAGAESELIRRVSSTNPDTRMPPNGDPLTPKEILTLKRWIDEDATYERHWAFLPPVKPSPPTLDKSEQSWARNAIDHFVLAQRKSDGLPAGVSRHPAAAATPETLIRRVAFDLTGLPPTPQEVDRFIRDRDSDAYEKMVDRYLQTDAYGEHLARHWMDLARYADTNGYQYDTERQQWVWRDWVIHAYNQNMPFDQFTIEQLAGDLLPNATPQQRLATGFNRNHGITIEGGIVDEEYRVEYVMDRVNTTGSVWLGLTVGCARCHDHKFDPVSQREFYGLFAYFNQVPERGMRGFDPQEKIPSPLEAEQSREVAEQIAKLQQALEAPLDLEPSLEKWAASIREQRNGWRLWHPTTIESSGGSTLTLQPDHSVLAGGANPANDVYTIEAEAEGEGWTAVRLEALTDKSLPGMGPGRYSNSNFVLTEFELTVTSLKDLTQTQVVTFSEARADYSQANYGVALAVDGKTGKGGWAVDGPTRKQPATAIFTASKPFGFPGSFRMTARLRHESSFGKHGMGRVRLSINQGLPKTLPLQGPPSRIVEIARLAKSKRTEAQQGELESYYLKHHDPRQTIRNQIAELQQRHAASAPATMIMRDAEKPRETFVLSRGEYNAHAEKVTPGVPQVFPPMAPDSPANRLGLAKWLVDPAHPLTARVAVNRHWQRIFGVGLVKTSEDFGLQGELPSHPELLDWLATEFVDSQWNVKELLRLLLLSATYRQSSHVGAEAYRADPENRWLARGPRMRLDAEEIRDGALAISGLLKRQVGGPSVYPYQPAGLWLELNNRPGYSKAYPVGSGDALYRRSLYTFWKRTVPSPMMKTFDAPEREFCTLRRSKTNTPLQSLLLWNAPQYVEAARHMAARVLREEVGSNDERITLAFRLATARKPSPQEAAVLQDLLNSEIASFKQDPAAVERLLGVGDSSVVASDDTTRPVLAAWTSLCRLILNLNETITKG